MSTNGLTPSQHEIVQDLQDGNKIIQDRAWYPHCGHTKVYRLNHMYGQVARISSLRVLVRRGILKETTDPKNCFTLVRMKKVRLPNENRRRIQDTFPAPENPARPYRVVKLHAPANKRREWYYESAIIDANGLVVAQSACSHTAPHMHTEAARLNDVYEKGFNAGVDTV